MNAAHPEPDFVPVDNPGARTLAAAEIAIFNRAGLLRPIPVFRPDEVARNQRYLDGLLAQIPDSGGYSINCYQARCAGIWDLCMTPRILDCVEDLIGPDIICWASHFFCKLPGDGKTVPWHQDAPYWHLAPTRTVTAWLAIDDADEGNSAMRYIPGSHRLGKLRIRKSGADSVLDLETADVDSLGEPAYDCLRAGEMSLHADLLVHGSLPNVSARRRCGLTIRYCPPAVQFTNERWASQVEPIVCRGRDPYGRWRHHPRPEGDDVSPGNSPHNIGGN